MTTREIGLSTNSLYDSYEHYFGKRRQAMAHDPELEIEALGHLLGVIDTILRFEACDHLTPTFSKTLLATLRETRDCYDRIRKRNLDARLEAAEARRLGP